MVSLTIILFGMFLVYFGAKPKNKKKIVPTPAGGKIQTELVPRAMHGINVRSRVDAKTWMAIAQKTHYLNLVKYKLHKDQCEVCRSNGFKQGFGHALEAHEEWRFDHATRTQKLARIRSLCPLCHKAVHFGLAKKDGYGERVKKHMMAVNGWTLAQVEAHIAQALQTVKTLNETGRYKLDLCYLNSKEYAGTHQFRFTTNETHHCRPGVYY